MMIHKKIIETHGRIEDVKLFDKDPTSFIKEAKEREAARLQAIKDAEKAKQEAEENGEEVEESKEAAAAQIPPEEENKEPEYLEFSDPSMTIYDIFKEYGKPTKAEADEAEECKKELYYDFTPFNAKDPILLSLRSVF